MGKGFIGPTEAYSGVVSGTDPISTRSYDIRRYVACAFHAVYGSGLSADFKIYGSNDDINFDDTGVFVKAASGTADNSIANLDGLGFAFVKMVIEPSNGSAQVNITFSAKEG